MSNIEDLCRELQRADELVATITQRLEAEQAEISNSMNKAQNIFGTIREGQYLVQELFSALNRLIYANDALCSLRSEITQTMNKARK